MKAIKDSMRTVNPSAVKYTSAEQFLAANRRPCRLRDPVEQERIRRDSYVPDFQARIGSPGAGGYTAPPPLGYSRVETELPEKRNFFRRLGSQNNSNQSPREIDRGILRGRQNVPRNTPAIEQAAPVSQSPDLPESSPGRLLGKVFGGRDDAAPAVPQPFEAPVEAADQRATDTMAPVSSGPAPIFVSPENASGTLMTVRQTTRAEGRRSSRAL